MKECKTNGEVTWSMLPAPNFCMVNKVSISSLACFVAKLEPKQPRQNDHIKIRYDFTREDTVLQLTYMMSSGREHADSERREVEQESDATIICRCTNVCNRAVGRGSCPCLRNDRSCSRLCKCGTAKMGCKNMQQDQSLVIHVK